MEQCYCRIQLRNGSTLVLTANDSHRTSIKTLEDFVLFQCGNTFTYILKSEILYMECGPSGT